MSEQNEHEIETNESDETLPTEETSNQGEAQVEAQAETQAAAEPAAEGTDGMLGEEEPAPAGADEAIHEEDAAAAAPVEEGEPGAAPQPAPAPLPLGVRVETLERDMESRDDKTRFNNRLRTLIDAVEKDEALEDREALLARLRALDESVQAQFTENLGKKEALVVRAEELRESGDWKATAEAYKALQAEWKAVGPAPQEQANALWTNFRAAANAFFERRKEHYDVQDKQQKENLTAKEALCVRAEELSGSTEWKSTAEAFKALQDEWKAVGPVPKNKADAIWERFRGAANQFFEKRKEHYKELEKQQKDNLRKKEALCVRAEEMASSTEWRSTVEAIKALQAEWRTVGPAPKNRADAVWTRFRAAIDQFFARQAAYFEDRDKRQGDRKDQMREALTRKQEQLERLNESITRDEENLERWRVSLGDVTPGPRGDDIRESLNAKISDVDTRRAGKLTRRQELEAAIQELEAKV